MLENCRSFLWRAHQWPPLSPGTQSLWLCPDHLQCITFKMMCSVFLCYSFSGHLKGKTQLWPDFGPPMVLHWTGQESSQSPHSPFTCSPWSLCDVLGEIKQLGCDCDLIWFDSPDDQFLCCTKVCRCCQPKRIWCDINDLPSWCSILWQTGVWGTWQSALTLLCQGPHTSNIGGLIFCHLINLWWQILQFGLTVVHWVYCIPLYWKGKTHCSWSTVKQPPPPFCKHLSFMGQLFFTIFITFVFRTKLTKFSQHWHWAYNPGNYKLYHHQFWFHIQPILSPPSSTSPWSSAWSISPSSKSSSHHDNKNQDKSSDENSKCHPRQSTSAKSNQPPFQEIKIKTKGRVKLSSHILNQPVIGSLLREWYPQLFGPRVWRSAWARINEFKIVVKVDQFMLLWILKNTWSIVEQRCHYVLCKTPPKP